MHGFHFACDYDGFEAGCKFLIVFAMLGSKIPKIKEIAITLGSQYRGGVISGKFALACTASCDSNTYNVDTKELVRET